MIRVAPRKTMKGSRPWLEQGRSLSYCPRIAVESNRLAADTRSERGGAH
jgi:hypothetical protein